MRVLVTGCAGFIGFHVAKKLLANGNVVIGIDNLNNYYDISLKNKRLKILKKFKKFKFKKIDICNSTKLNSVFKQNKIQNIIHLAAQAGVRYSLMRPKSYINSNIKGFFNIIECCRYYGVVKLLYASTSSVYGNQKKFPLKEDFNTDNPIQLYAATKKSNELMAKAYSHLFNFQTIGMRFFTVYGPWGRPDMALFKFTKKILSNREIEIYNYGNHIRDFTYIDDVTEIIFRLNKTKKIKKNSEIFNIGNSNPVKLIDYIHQIEKSLNKRAKKKYLPLQAGDNKKTHSNTKKLRKILNYRPKVNFRVGVNNFVKWYRDHYSK